MTSIEHGVRLARRILPERLGQRVQLAEDNARYFIQNPSLRHFFRYQRLAAVGKSPLDTTASLEKAKMLAGDPYDAQDFDLLRACDWAVSLYTMFNNSSVIDKEFRFRVLEKLFGRIGEGTVVEPPFYCAYGRNIHVGSRVYFNVGCVILDRNLVVISDEVKLGPQVLIATVNHPLDPVARNKDGVEYALPIRIENGVWVGMGAKILPGITIGENAIVAAGAVVTKDLPPGMVVGGVPAKVLGTWQELNARSRTNRIALGIEPNLTQRV